MSFSRFEGDGAYQLIVPSKLHQYRSCLQKLQQRIVPSKAAPISIVSSKAAPLASHNWRRDKAAQLAGALAFTLAAIARQHCNKTHTHICICSHTHTCAGTSLPRYIT